MLGPVRGTLVTFTSELLSAINSSCVVLEVVSEVYDQPMAVEGRGSPIMYVPARQNSSYYDNSMCQTIFVIF